MYIFKLTFDHKTITEIDELVTHQKIDGTTHIINTISGLVDIPDDEKYIGYLILNPFNYSGDFVTAEFDYDIKLKNASGICTSGYITTGKLNGARVVCNIEIIDPNDRFSKLHNPYSILGNNSYAGFINPHYGEVTKSTNNKSPMTENPNTVNDENNFIGNNNIFEYYTNMQKDAENFTNDFCTKHMGKFTNKKS